MKVENKKLFNKIMLFAIYKEKRFVIGFCKLKAQMPDGNSFPCTIKY